MPLSKVNSTVVYSGFGCFLFVAFGLILFPWTIWNKSRVEAMLEWPHADATVVAADVVSTYERPVGDRFKHSLQFQYNVAGELYLGDKISYGGPAKFWETESAARSALPAIGSTIQIRYDPTHPNDSVVTVIQIQNTKTWIIVGFNATLGLIGLILMIVFIRRGKLPSND